MALCNLSGLTACTTNIWTTNKYRLMRLKLKTCTCYLYSMLIELEVIKTIVSNCNKDIGACYTRAWIKINVDPKQTCQVQIMSIHNTVDCRARLTSVLRVVFEDATLTKCCVWRRDSNEERHLPHIKAWRYLSVSITSAYMHLCTICCFQIYSTRSYLWSVKKNSTIQIQSELVSPFRTRIDLDPHSRVASP